MTISFSMRVTIPENILKRELDGEAVILNLNTERYYGLDRVGTRMLEALNDSPSIQAAFEKLLLEYEVEAEVLRHDLEILIDNLVGRGLVELIAA